MEEAEKMAALKKAYADIILNTAKEAAARIMVSERRAARCEQEKAAAKAEALNMLMRMKHMMDCKIVEMEGASLGQRRKIEELEAQLHEAEDMVTDLREQLRGLQDELEKVRSDVGQSPGEHVIKEGADFCADASEDTKLNPSEFISFSFRGSEHQILSTSEMKDSPLPEENIDVTRCSTLGSVVAEDEPMGESPPDKICAGNSDIDSLIMRSKETELYRNGCTQRIRAFESNLLNAKLPILEEANGQHVKMKNESTIREDGTAEPVYVEASPIENNGSEDQANGLELLSRQYSNCDKNQNAKGTSFRRSSRRRRATYKSAEASSGTVKRRQSCNLSILSVCKSRPGVDNSIRESGEDLSNIMEQDEQKNSDVSLVQNSSPDAIDVDPQLGCMDPTGMKAEVNQEVIVQKALDEDAATVNKSELSGGNTKFPDDSEVIGCKQNIEIVPPSYSDVKDDRQNETSNKAPTKAVNDKLIKYTVRRKRKKEPISCPEEDAPLAMKKSGEKPSSAELQKSSLIVESSRDSRRMFQVARQLISLSEKKWWQ
ncbi:hypothetical protein Scep_017657 [Stephania cephalantha]|uniref:Uncharacterized protein n=1 Tax=Stephania cephalantha TaxID=152367 RepID=A0AAP0IPU7_9MAGN